MRVLSIIGIRPDFIRMSQVIRLLDCAPLDHKLAHSGQHYTYNVNGVFFDELGIRPPDYNMGVGSGTHAEQTAKLLVETERLLTEVQPDLCVFLGDSNTSLAAIAAAKSNVKVAHIEAGMRSFDWRMPEEKNRTIVDHISDYLYAYTPRYRENLLAEGIPTEKIIITGNPIVDVVHTYLDQARKRRNIFGETGVSRGQYVLATVHRAENVDNQDNLRQILAGLDAVGRRLDVPVVFPMYYRTQQRISEAGMELPPSIRVLEPLGFLDFLNLEANALCLVSDSGTVQEEACVLKVPCVTIRLSTERPETVEVGANVLSGTDPDRIVECVSAMVDQPRDWPNPLGDGKASERIVNDIVARRAEIIEHVFIPPLSDARKKASFAPFVAEGTKLALEPTWAVTGDAKR